jgi:hypothetical protein
MMKVVVVLLTTVALTLPARSGDLFELGVRAGANLASGTGLPSGFSQIPGSGWSAGVYGQVGIGGLLAVSAELYYENASFTLESSSSGVTVSDPYLLTTLNLPVVLRIGLPLSFFLDLGASYAQYLDHPDMVSADAAAFAVLGLQWHPLDSWRVGVRFQPSLTTIGAPSISDLGTNLSQVYIAYVLL